MKKLPLAAFFFSMALAAPAQVTSAQAAQCGGDFNTFISNISREAASKGISQGVISQALGGVFDQVPNALRGLVPEHGRGVVAGPALWRGHAPQPHAVGVAVEIIGRPDGGVDRLRVRRARQA